MLEVAHGTKPIISITADAKIRPAGKNWSPTYLREVKHFAMDKSSWAYFLYEYAGIPGTLLCGWMSDLQMLAYITLLSSR